jgi:hypothetical protein
MKARAPPPETFRRSRRYLLGADICPPASAPTLPRPSGGVFLVSANGGPYRNRPALRSFQAKRLAQALTALTCPVDRSRGFYSILKTRRLKEPTAAQKVHAAAQQMR